MNQPTIACAPTKECEFTYQFKTNSRVIDCMSCPLYSKEYLSKIHNTIHRCGGAKRSFVSEGMFYNHVVERYLNVWFECCPLKEII